MLRDPILTELAEAGDIETYPLYLTAAFPVAPFGLFLVIRQPILLTKQV
jgi:hypothetical protein